MAIAGQAENDEHFEISWAKIDKATGIPLDPQRRQFTAFPNTALYSPVPYLPQSAAIGPRGFCEPAPLTMLYLARIANLIVYLFLAAAAVRLAPIHNGRWPWWPCCRCPSTLRPRFGRRRDARPVAADRRPDPESRFGQRQAEPPRFVGLGFLLVLLALSNRHTSVWPCCFS